MSSIEITATELLQHVRELEAKARAYDALVSKLEDVADHLDARAMTYFRDVKAYNALEDLTEREVLIREWSLGRGDAYRISAGYIREVLKWAGSTTPEAAAPAPHPTGLSGGGSFCA